MFIVSVIVYSHAAVFTSYVQFVRLAAGRPTQLDSSPTPMTNGAIDETLQQFAPLIDDCLLQLVECLESSTLIKHLLKGTPNSVQSTADSISPDCLGATC